MLGSGLFKDVLGCSTSRKLKKRGFISQVALENATDDMDLMSKLLDELDTLQQKAEASDLYNVDVSINKMMPELGFTADDADRLVASFSGGWQMRIALGKILLQVSPRIPLLFSDLWASLAAFQ